MEKIIEDKLESDEFRSGNDLNLSFVSPVSGNIAVYLVDAEQTVFCFLPYRNQTNDIYNVETNRRYLFFNTKDAPAQERQYVNEPVMTCSSSSEHNQIYVVFSQQFLQKQWTMFQQIYYQENLSLKSFKSGW